jgi:uncharacterized protein
MSSYVLITGAAGGLGKAFAAECASRGWNLLLTDLSEEALAPLAGGLERMYGVQAICIACDLTDPVARDEFWAAIERRRLQFHFLINVAGVDVEGKFLERRLEEIHTVIRLNIESTVDTTRRVLAARNPSGLLRILTVSSLGAFYPMPHKAVYAASKRFLLDWSLALRQELSGSGVTITVLCPGGMPTNSACREAIEAQGFFGNLTTLNVGQVVCPAIDHALAGRALFIPGAINNLLHFFSQILPPSLLASLIGARWDQAWEKRRLADPRMSYAASAG